MEGHSPHYLGHRQRLKERLARQGLGSFQNHEAVELLLTYALARKDVKPLAKKLLQTFGSFRGLLEARPAEVKKVEGVSDHTALLFKLVKEASEFYLREKLLACADVISSPGDLVNYCRLKMSGLKDEQIRMIYLNTRNQVIEEEVLQEGTIDQTAVYPRKILERAIQVKATALIMVHNHPSGSPQPSLEDRELTRALVQATGSLQIKLHDHLIIGRDTYFSFLENNAW